jgi:Response regulators consisting of a CheY-like receiver domain and a winged-helix DNA-binding domain
MKSILIIEDEKYLREELKFLLENEGFNVDVIDDFEDVLLQVLSINPDLVLLDVGLPGKDGYTLCMEMRRNINVPIIFVTSQDSSMDELKGLSVGADDFITKPYNIPILIARVKAIMKRLDINDTDGQLEHKGLKLDILKSIAEYKGNSCEITKNELRILHCLMEKPEVVIARADLIEYLWDNQIFIDDNTLSVNITRLRSKLQDIGLEDYIITKHKMGYKV